ncbi:hypothetical protein [Nocardiopsis suaedae]|uniref:Secreted protein n=1 Tax=Nocardiopsis suaedae TaxID=3018444 RepID=A0ABT4TFK1_9ACTN|nr:hypothetical protein [Nocardiopsis suaedae]MDA2803462.1 hypothetical protein [Nocardiopsis suaedae]
MAATYGRAALGAAALLSALLLGGCAGQGGGAAAPDGSPSPGEGAEADGVEFAQCMRDNGIDVEDPKGDGMMPALPAGDGAVEKALEECEDLLPSSDDERSEEEVFQENLEMAECLREHGMDIEDPERGEGLAIPLTDDEESQAALEECGQEVTVGGGGE